MKECKYEEFMFMVTDDGKIWDSEEGEYLTQYMDCKGYMMVRGI